MKRVTYRSVVQTVAPWAKQSQGGLRFCITTSPIPQRLSSHLSPQVQINVCLPLKTLSVQFEVKKIPLALPDVNSVLSCALKLSLYRVGTLILLVDRALITLLLRDIDSKWSHWPQIQSNPNDLLCTVVYHTFPHPKYAVIPATNGVWQCTMSLLKDSFLPKVMLWFGCWIVNFIQVMICDWVR